MRYFWVLIWTFRFQRKEVQARDLSSQTTCFGDFFCTIFFLSVKHKCVFATFILEMLFLGAVQHRWGYSCELVTSRSKGKLYDRGYMYTWYFSGRLWFSLPTLWAVWKQTHCISRAQSLSEPRVPHRKGWLPRRGALLPVALRLPSSLEHRQKRVLGCWQTVGTARM